MEEEGITYVSGQYRAKKDPLENLDFPFNWAENLNAIGDIITIAEVIPEDGVIVTGVIFTELRVFCMISGGTVNKTYRVMCKITTLGGRTMVRSLYLKIVPR